MFASASLPAAGKLLSLATLPVWQFTNYCRQNARWCCGWFPAILFLTRPLNALRDPRHPYRQALELSFGSVEVLTIEEALHLSRASVDGQTVVIVSTIQSFRVEDTTGRQVYSENGAFSEHLQNLSPGQIAILLQERMVNLYRRWLICSVCAALL